MMFLACADFDIWPLAWIGFIPLLFATRDLPPKQAFLYGWVAGIVGNAGGFYWITNLLVRFGRIPYAVAFVLFLLMMAYQGIHWGIWAALVRGCRQRWPRVPVALAAAAFMTALEVVMPFIFDWNVAITQAWVLPIIQIAELTGPLGVSFLLLLVNGALFELCEARWQKRPVPRLGLICAGVLVGGALVFGFVRLHQVDAIRQAAPSAQIGLVQANIGIVQKGRAELAVAHHQMHLRESWALQSAGADLIVWPESSYPFAVDRARLRDFPAGDPRQVMQQLKVPLIFGALSYSAQEPFPYNTAFMMQPGGEIVGRFDKNYLLVFGEYIPFYEHIPSFQRWFPASSNFARGQTVTTFPFRGKRIGMMICYEDILPAFGRRLGKLSPNLLINITNDAWFGQTAEPYQHLALAVYRSVELRLDLVRAVNTGVSAFVEATGRVRSKTPSYDPNLTPGVPADRLLDTAALMPGTHTVYARVGELFAYVNLAATVLFLLAAVFVPRLRRPRR